VYLADAISDGKNGMAYAVVPAVPPNAEPPLGPIGPQPLENNRLYLVQWPDCPLHPRAGEKLTVLYYRPDEAGQLRRSEEKIPFAGWVPLEGAADDGDLTPRFEGITDKLDIREWNNPPFPFVPKRVT